MQLKSHKEGNGTGTEEAGTEHELFYTPICGSFSKTENENENENENEPLLITTESQRNLLHIQEPTSPTSPTSSGLIDVEIGLLGPHSSSRLAWEPRSSLIESLSCLGFKISFLRRDKSWGFVLFAFFLSFALFAALISGILLSPFFLQPQQHRNPKNIIFMISDGFGPASQTMARNYWQSINYLPPTSILPLDSILVGSSRTRSASSLVTDSAAGATAFACAQKSYNGAIGVVGNSSRNARVCATVLEAAAEIGMLTGLVVTSRITHATPASFSAHVLGRDDENAIALQQIGNYSLGRRVDLMLGGGSCHFYPNTSVSKSCRGDSVDVFELAKQNGWNIGSGLASDLNDTFTLPYMNLFSSDHMDYSIDETPQQPTLSQMTSTALSALTQKQGKNGFFLMVEGSRIDMAAHSNDPATHIHEILAYNTAISIAKTYVDTHPDTLLVSTSDHETGGLSVAVQLGGYPEYRWNPFALQDARKSGESIARILTTLDPLVDRVTFVRNFVLKRWLGVGLDEQVEADVEVLANPSVSALEIEYRVGKVMSRRAEVGWATHGHSAVDVNLYAYGAFSNLFAGSLENTDIGSLFVRLLNLDLDSLTARLEKETLLV